MVRYLVTLAPVATVQAVESALTEVEGASVQRFSRSLGGFVVEAPEGSESRLAAVAGVSTAKPEEEVKLLNQVSGVGAPVPETVTGEKKTPAETEAGPLTGATDTVTHIRAPKAHREVGVTGEGIIAANLDTGACGQSFAADRRREGYSAVEDESDPWTDGNGHGSFTLGIMAGGPETPGLETGVAPGADLYPVKVLNSEGGGTTADIVEGFDAIFALADKNPYTPIIINNSWGFGDICEGRCGSAVTAAVNNLTDLPNVFVVFAAGNSGLRCGSVCDGSSVGIAGPNSVNNVLTVAATGADGFPDRLHDYSSRGGPTASCGDRKPDVAAPIFGTVPWRCGESNIGNYGGTSGACPHVAGTVGLVVAAAKGIPPDTEGFTAVRASGGEWNACRGHGNIDAVAAIKNLEEVKAAGINVMTIGGAVMASVAISGLVRRYTDWLN